MYNDSVVSQNCILFIGFVSGRWTAQPSSSVVPNVAVCDGSRGVCVKKNGYVSRRVC